MNTKDRLLIQQAINKNTVQYSVNANFAQMLNHESTSIQIDNQRGLIIFKHRDKTIVWDIHQQKFIGIPSLDQLALFLRFVILNEDGISFQDYSRINKKKIMSIFGVNSERVNATRNRFVLDEERSDKHKP